MSLREEVEKILPGWKRWYPSLFDAANDLGVIRARVCSPDDLLLSKRHARIQTAAEAAHRQQWGGSADDKQ
jgi:hypothetical protein